MPVKQGIRVVLIDEAVERRSALDKLLAGIEEAAVVGESGYGPEAVTMVEQCHPEVAVLGMEEPIARPMRTMEALQLSFPDLSIIVVSSLSDRDHLRKAMLAGAKDYLVKPVSAGALEESLLTVYMAKKRYKTAKSDSDGAGVRQGDLVMVFGTKGGIGKTVLATNLAISLATNTKARVALVDLDLQMGNVATMLDMVPDRDIGDIARSIDGMRTEELQSMLVPHSSGVMVLPACRYVEDADGITEKQVRATLSMLARIYDYVIIDSPPHFEESVIGAMDLSTLVLLVSSVEVPCLKNTKLFLNVANSLQFSQDKLKLVLNNLNNSLKLQNSEVEKLLEYPVFWQVPYDTTVHKAVREGQPFVMTSPGARVSRSLNDLSRLISGANKPKNGLFGWLFRRTPESAASGTLLRRV